MFEPPVLVGSARMRGYVEAPRRPLTAISMMLAVLVCACSGEGPTRPFDATAWRSADLATRVRAEMTDDLFEKHPLRGLSKAEVVSLLGQPTETDKYPRADMVYVLGPDAGYGIDHAWLLIQLDGAGRVSDYVLHTD